MKNILICFFLSFLISEMDLHAQEMDSLLYQKKIHSAETGMKVGGILVFTGGILTASGLTWYVLETSNDNNANQLSWIDGRELPVLLTLAGIPMVITGIVINKIGSERKEYYERKYPNLSIITPATLYAPVAIGISYNF